MTVDIERMTHEAGLPAAITAHPGFKHFARLVAQQIDDLRRINRALAEDVRVQGWALEAKQAKIDALMLEWCPDEMTPEQLAEWARHQRPGK